MRSKNTLEHFFLTELKMEEKQVVNFRKVQGNKEFKKYL